MTRKFCQVAVLCMCISKVVGINMLGFMSACSVCDKHSSRASGALPAIDVKSAMIELANRGGFTVVIADDVGGKVKASFMAGDPLSAFWRIAAKEHLFVAKRDGAFYVMKGRRPGW